MMVLIDNYDSFSYNLYQLLSSAGTDVMPMRNDALSVRDLDALAPEAVILSPGPGRPADAGICEDIVRELSGKIPILGVCLGHQAICEGFGGSITYAPRAMHGKSSRITCDDACPLFANVGTHAQVGRYHSLVADEATLPSCLRIVARADDGQIMAVQHATHPTFGLQFHPESILTPQGRAMALGFMEVVQSCKA